MILTDGETPLHEAVKQGKIDDVQEVIIHQGILIQLVDHAERTVF